jgi:hypothetical protein
MNAGVFFILYFLGGGGRGNYRNRETATVNYGFTFLKASGYAVGNNFIVKICCQ